MFHELLPPECPQPIARWKQALMGVAGSCHKVHCHPVLSEMVILVVTMRA